MSKEIQQIKSHSRMRMRSHPPDSVVFLVNSKRSVKCARDGAVLIGDASVPSEITS